MDPLSVIYLVSWLVLLLVLAVPGYRMQATARAAIARNRRARDWPVTTGTVTGAHVEKRKRRMVGRRGPLGTRTTITYQPVISYTYTLDGRPYQGSRYRFGWPADWTTNSRRTADTIVGQYLAGKPAMVHYDPADPAQACLEIETSETGLQAVRGVGLAMLAAAAVLFAFGAYTVARGVMADREVTAIRSSAAVLPVTTLDIKTALERDLGLTCQAGLPAGYAGIHVSYQGWSCQLPSNKGLAIVDVWSRREEPEKTDLLWAYTDRTDQERDRTLLAAAAALAVPEPDSQAARDWVWDALPSMKQVGDRAETTIAGIGFTLDVRSETRLNLSIGASQ